MFTIAIYIFLFVVSCFLLSRLLKRSENHSGFRDPPCLPYLPIVGSLPFISDPQKSYIYFMKKSKELGNVIGYYMGNKYVVMLNGRQTIYDAYVKKSSIFSSRPLFAVCGKYNSRQKGVIEHPYDEEFILFHKAYMNVFKHFGIGQGLMELRIQTEVEHLIQRIKLKNDQPFNPLLELTAAVSNVISSICYGKRWPNDDPEHMEFFRISETFAKGFILNFFPTFKYLPYFRGRFKKLIEVLKSWEKFINKYIKEILEDKTSENFCNKFKEEVANKTGSSGKLHEIDEEHCKLLIRDFTIAGTDTTTNGLLWFLYFLANHQDVQKEVRDELNRVVGVENFPSLEHKPNLPITEACILEMLRMKTLVPLAVPHFTLEDSVVNGNFIPKSTVVVTNLYSAHMDPEEWEEPEKFNIGRFLNTDRTEVVNRNLVIPFSLGKRSCLGEPLARQIMFQFVSALVKQFHILPPLSHDTIVAEEVIGVTISPSPFNVRFVGRS